MNRKRGRPPKLDIQNTVNAVKNWAELPNNITTREAAIILRVVPETIQRLIKNGKIEAGGTPGKRWIPKENLMRFCGVIR
jgi:excisionase family DNA binding protein